MTIELNDEERHILRLIVGDAYLATQDSGAATPDKVRLLKRLLDKLQA